MPSQARRVRARRLEPSRRQDLAGHEQDCEEGTTEVHDEPFYSNLNARKVTSNAKNHDTLARCDGVGTPRKPSDPQFSVVTSSVVEKKGRVTTRPAPGVRLAWKAEGETSTSLVRAVQTALEASPGKAWKVCHGGALDPFARGLVPVLIGPATKLFELIHELPKTYRAIVEWGRETSTGDGAGATTLSGETTGLTEPRLSEALLPFLGWTAQVPPSTSNKRVDGERAYRKAHRGEAVELPPVKVFLANARWTAHHLPTHSELELTCRGGFYVRSLARELGRALGCGAHLRALTRDRIGPWQLDEGAAPITLEAVEAFSWLPTVHLHDDEWAQVKVAVKPAQVSLRERPKPARWPWPAGFPRPSPLVLALHQTRGVALLRQADHALEIERLLLPPL